MERTPEQGLTLKGDAARAAAGQGRRGASAWTAALCLVALLWSCAPPEPSFGALLARIDAAQSELPVAVFTNAAALADTTVDRLRILKRARAWGSGTYAAVASVIVTASPSCVETVALAALDAFLEAGRHEEALALFDGPLDPRQRPLEYAETIVRLSAFGLVVKAPAERLVWCYDATGARAFLEYAAVDAMASGDRSLALTLLRDSAGPSSEPMTERLYRLLWDAGAREELAARPVREDDPLGLALKADVDYLRGDRAMAAAGYAAIIERFPLWSWKPYAALARAEATEALGQASLAVATSPALALADFSRSTERRGTAERYYDLLARRFPADAEAALERARWLHRSGRRAEAGAIAAAVHGERGAIAALAHAEPRRRQALALRLASAYPESPPAMEAALEALALEGAWERFQELFDRASLAGLRLPRAWFWGALAAVLDGNVEEALLQYDSHADAAHADAAHADAAIEARGVYIDAYNRGLVLAALERLDEAEASFARAASSAGSRAEAARALTLAGDAAWIDGRHGNARRAYEAALGAEPASRDARARLERLRRLGY